MSPASEFMAEVSLAHSYPELDVWQRYKPDSSKGFGTLNPGFPFSPLQCRHAGLGWGGVGVHVIIYRVQKAIQGDD